MGPFRELETRSVGCMGSSMHGTCVIYETAHEWGGLLSFWFWPSFFFLSGVIPLLLVRWFFLFWFSRPEWESFPWHLQALGPFSILFAVQAVWCLFKPCGFSVMRVRSTSNYILIIWEINPSTRCLLPSMKSYVPILTTVQPIALAELRHSVWFSFLSHGLSTLLVLLALSSIRNVDEFFAGLPVLALACAWSFK